MNTAIVTDTNSGIFPERGNQLGIYVVPMPVIIEGRTYYEGDDLTPNQFYQFLAEGKNVSTSQPSISSLFELWDNVLEKHDSLVYIPMSSGLSSSCKIAQGLAIGYNGRVQVVDNHRISLTLESSVLDAKALSDAGCTASEIKTELEGTAYDSITYVGVETLEYLKRGGRITAAGAALSTILNIKPLLKIEGGQLDAYAKVRGTAACQKRLTAVIQESVEIFARKGWKWSVGVADSYCDPSVKNNWLTAVSKQLMTGNIMYAPLTCSIGSHVGPNAFGMAFGMAASRRIAI